MLSTSTKINMTHEAASVDIKNLLVSCIMDLTIEERKELLAMWKGRHNK